MASLTKAEVAQGRRIDGTVIHVTDSAIWVRDKDGLESSIKWPSAHEDVRNGHRISAFVTADGTGQQIRNHGTGRILSTFNETAPEAYAWAAVAGLGEKGLTIALVPGFNYLILLHIATVCLLRNFRVFVKGALLFGLMTLPFMYLGTASEGRRGFNAIEMWVARGILVAGLILLSLIAIWGIRLVIRGRWFAKLFGLLVFLAFGGFVGFVGLEIVIVSGIFSPEGMSTNHSLMYIIDRLARDVPHSVLGLIALAFGPTAVIVYAMKELTALDIRDHNAAVKMLESQMA